MFINKEQLILASASPRRRDFLRNLHIDFAVMGADIDESVPAGESPFDFVLRLAQEKAGKIAKDHPDTWVLGADTVVVKGGEILGKPDSAEQAVNMLKSLAGLTHQVWTGFCLCCRNKRKNIARAVKTDVTFAELDEALIRAYVATGECLDKAGAYGIQGLGGCLVKGVCGSYSNVVGLPLTEVISELLKQNIIIAKSPS